MRWLTRSRPMGAVFGGIRFRLFGMILLVIVPLLVIHGFDLYQERKRNIEAAHDRALDLAHRGAGLYERTIVEARMFLDVVAQVPEVVSGAPAACTAFLERASGGHGWLRALWVVGPDRRVVCSTTPAAVGVDMSDRPHIRQAMETGDFVVSDFFFGRVNRMPMSALVRPLLDANGTVIGALSMSLDLDWFNRLAAEVGRDADARVLLFDAKDTLVARYPARSEFIGRSWRGYPLLNRMLDEAQGWAEIPSQIGEHDQIYGWTTVPGTQSRIAIGLDRDKVLGRVNGEFAVAGFAFLLAALLAALASFPLAHGIVKPLKVLTAGAEAARDRAGAALPQVHGYAEVRSLAQSLNKLLAERQAREHDLTEARAVAERAEQHAREAHGRLSAAIEMLPEGIAIFDADDRFVLWNRRYADLYAAADDGPAYGMRFEDLVRQVMARRQHPGAIGREEEWLAGRLALHAMPESTHEQPLAGGRWLRVEERRMTDGGSIGIWVDITELKRREASFRLLFESNPVPMWVYDRQTLCFLAVNDAAVKHYGYSREQFLAMSLLDIRPADQREMTAEYLKESVRETSDRLWEHTKADGTLIKAAIYARELTHDGREAALVAVIDVTEQVRAEDELRRTRTFLDAVVENIPAMLFVKELTEHRYVLLNRAGEDLLGVPRSGMIGYTDHDLFPKREADQFVAGDREVAKSGRLEIVDDQRVHTPHNGLRVLRTKKIAIPDTAGRPQYLLGISEDITDRKRTEARITHMAHHDFMTGLANRVLLRERLEKALGHMREAEGKLAVLYVDLDSFKDVNDALGHPVGDALLRIAGERLRACVRDTDTVARLGGDEFAIIQDDIAGPDEVSTLARRIVEKIGAPFHVDGHEVVVSASVGIAMAPRDGCDPDSLLKFADMALYAAKTSGRRTYRFFEPDMNARLHARRTLETDLRAAFARDEFELYYQPSIEIASGRLVAFEALLRWNHPQRGLVGPGEFIPAAESIGLMVPLGEWVLRSACAEAAKWPDHVSVAVNLAPSQFNNGNLVHTVMMALASSGLPARRLELEITETVLLQENEKNPATLRQLRDLGVKIALDDFGTGYSSLSYVRVFPFDRIKIDGSFVKELPHNAECVSIIRAVADLARGLNMATTAEGVETQEQLEHLRADGCTAAQGYLFSPPVPAREIRRLLAQDRLGRAA